MGFVRWQQAPKLRGASEQGGSCKSICGLTLEVAGVDFAVCFWWKRSAVCRNSAGGTLTLHLIVGECQGVNLELLCDSVSSFFAQSQSPATCNFEG